MVKLYDKEVTFVNMGKNDEAWEKLFDKYDILKQVDDNKFFRISSKQINEFRESRLMTKFDNSDQLPLIFSNNKITILPDSRGNYVIGRFKMFQSLNFEEKKPISVEMPEYIQSIDTKHITSESIALNVAHLTNMIDYVMETGDNEPSSLLTLNGRMSSGVIDYKILNQDKSFHNFKVENAQIEIDGSYENLNNILIVEAKNKLPKDFNIRQLYYPYRFYKKLQTNKKISPVFFTLADDIYSFHVYEFLDDLNYSSIRKIDQISFILNDKLDLSVDDLIEISSKTEQVEEPRGVPFPQANNFARILDMIDYLSDPKDKHELADAYDFDERQSDYYANSLVYLGLAIKENRKFVLNEEGHKVRAMKNSNNRNKIIISKILMHKPFKLAFDSTVQNQGEYDREYISSVIATYAGTKKGYGPETAKRRMQSVVGWLNWIFNVAV